ncbi:MAG: LysM peptidoglycan-binding domain-containing protein [Verrucomicrobia bacterium]|nr:LysM peptidoglycan-binding domain-containing protein [Verrucomicrobiota bacterium]
MKKIVLAGTGALLLPAGGLLWAQDAATVHVVQRGDTLSGLAQRYNVSVADLRVVNNLQSDVIRVGQRLSIPRSGVAAAASALPSVHVVQRGDTLSGIARRYQTTIAEIQQLNGLQSTRITIGQQLRIPGADDPLLRSPYLANVIQATNNLRIERGRWEHIVGHHSAIERGNARTYDRVHREQRGMTNGLAYHFVIGNGVDSGLGQIEIGNRWTQQLQGGHVRNHQVNLTGIGICVVGNFEERHPHPQQIEAFTHLVQYLRNHVLRGQRVRFAVHREIDQQHTLCPGRNFPTRALHRRFPS